MEFGWLVESSKGWRKEKNGGKGSERGEGFVESTTNSKRGQR